MPQSAAYRNVTSNRLQQQPNAGYNTEYKNQLHTDKQTYWMNDIHISTCSNCNKNAATMQCVIWYLYVDCSYKTLLAQVSAMQVSV